MFRQDDFGSEAGTIGAVLAFADAVEAVAGGDDPRAGGGTIQIFAEVLKYGGMFGWNCRKVVECFVDAGCQACGCDVVAQYSLIHDLGKEARLGGQLLKHVRDVFLSFRREGLLISGSSAKRNDDDLPLLCRCLSV